MLGNETSSFFAMKNGNKDEIAFSIW